MRTRSSSTLIIESFRISKRRNRRRSKQIVEPELRTIVETLVATMADTRTMLELLQAPTEGYGDAIVIPAILAENFELKVGLLSLVTSSQFHDFERTIPILIFVGLTRSLLRLNYESQEQHHGFSAEDVVKAEIIKLLDARLIYAIYYSLWVSPIHVVPKKGRITIMANENNELIPTRTIIGWRVCIDYQKLNESTRKYHFPLPFIDQMLERLSGNDYYYFLDGFSGYFQIPLALEDQEKTTFTYPYETFAYRRMPFGLCNAPATFQRCMTTIFHDMCKYFMEVFMEDFSIFW
nr:RNA-directed DNA polymerase homolog [Tanacetum cinerariifolium]